jgi:hypothetical protein
MFATVVWTWDTVVRTFDTVVATFDTVVAAFDTRASVRRLPSNYTPCHKSISDRAKVSHHGMGDARRKFPGEGLEILRDQLCAEMLTHDVLRRLLDPFLLQSEDRTVMSLAVRSMTFMMEDLTSPASACVLPSPEGRSSLEPCTDG